MAISVGSNPPIGAILHIFIILYDIMCYASDGLNPRSPTPIQSQMDCTYIYMDANILCRNHKTIVQAASAYSISTMGKPEWLSEQHNNIIAVFRAG